MSRHVSKWLESLGLGQHAEAFARNGVDFDLLRELTNEDLKELGLARLGDRKRLLRAIARLAQASPQAAAKDPAPAREAERRQLTVMFCDLVGSTALAGALDPESLRDVLRAFQKTCAAVVERYDGYIAKYTGDGMLVYFGIPRTHEDDAPRAVSAGLGMVEAVEQLNQVLRRDMGIELSIRVGVHTGLVVAGEMGAGAAREEMAIVGETPNIAARLQAFALPNAVVISSSTRRLVGGLFSYEDVGVHALKGLARPMQLWRVTGERPTESRFEALRSPDLVPMVGREAELDLLLRRWEQAGRGEAAVVLISGEPGIGKSRLMEALRERMAGVPHTRLLCQCSPYFTNSALYPFVRQLEQAAQLTRGEAPEAKLDKLERLLATSGQNEPETAALLAALLSIPTGARYPPLDLPPLRMKEKIGAALVDRMLGLAAQHAVLLVVEDAHWIDPSSEELLGLAIDRLRAARVLVLITHRPDYAPPWTGPGDVTRLTLNRLSRAQAAAMVAGLAAAALPPETAYQIVARADGVPLFVEELTRAMLEAEPAAGSGHPGVAPRSAIPATLHDTLMARLERSPAAKEVAQTAAVLGRDFSEALLAEVSSLDAGGLIGALDELVQAGLLYRSGAPPQTRYLFKHALVQDAAYETLLLRDRQQLHARTATAIEQRFAEVAEVRPELLAHHYEAAGIPERAIVYWQRAGMKAIRSSSYIEAERELMRAVSLLPQVPEDAQHAAEFDLRMALGAVYRATRGSGSPLTEQAYARARALRERLGGDDRLLEVIYGQFISAFNRPRVHDAERYAQEFMQVAQDSANAPALLVAHQLVGTAAFIRGDLLRARQHLETCLRSGEADVAALRQYSQGQYPGMALTYLGWTLFALGYPEQAHARADEAVAASKDLSEFLYAMALSNGCYLHHICGDRAAVEANLAALLDLAGEKGIVVFYETARVFQGWVQACRGAFAEGVALMRQALERLRATEQRLEDPYLISILAETYLQAGRLSEAQEQLDEALGLVEATDERWYEAELHRLVGEVALARGDKAGAEHRVNLALTIAGAQSARLWGLRSATRLARLWRDSGRNAEARALMSSALAGFTEGFETADLRAARALLDALD